MKGLRNRLEARVRAQLSDEWQYEPIRLPYTLECSYTPDFVDIEGRRIIETKGLFSPEDRRKMLAVKRQHPEWSIEIRFSNPLAKISKGSKTTYAAWCDKQGFDWSKAK